jgi:hypothetical protein
VSKARSLCSPYVRCGTKFVSLRSLVKLERLVNKSDLKTVITARQGHVAERHKTGVQEAISAAGDIQITSTSTKFYLSLYKTLLSNCNK